ncbi:MAG: Mur ligase domain-containing protein, partial [Tsuneonella sp.]
MSARAANFGPVLRWPADRRDALGLALWDAEAVAAATGGTGNGAFQCAGVEIDSRDVRSGDLFFALRGEATDGHRFIDKAFANGAAAAVVDRPIEQPHVLVEDTTRALVALGAAAGERAQARRIGVTGSVGK